MPVDRLTRSDSSGDSGSSQLFSIKSTRDLMSASSFLSSHPEDQDDSVWNCLGLSYPSTFSYSEPLGPPWRLCVLVRRLFDRLIDRDSSEAVGGAKLN